ncbi:unnamed protein product [Meganyctiphanes norvegica]|uniref:Uncharacterized protein n=1 Tax=Meganyctiphanes norvegica TaxID=48144 RepID=A0AAV2RN94_MEGNR
MVGSSRFWVCVVFFVLGTCQGATNIQSGDEVYLQNDSCTLHRGWIKCTTLPFNKCSTQKEDWSSLTIMKEDGTDIMHGDLVALRHAKGKWLDCNHTSFKCEIEQVHDGDVGGDTWTSSTQQHFIIKNKLGFGHISDGQKIFLEYVWETGHCMRPSESLIIGNQIVTDACNENIITGFCDPWLITLETPTIPTAGPTTAPPSNEAYP